MGLFSAIFGSNKKETNNTATTANNISVTPETSVSTTVNNVIDLEKPAELITGSLTDFSQKIGTAGTAIGQGFSQITKAGVAVALIVVIGASLRE